MKSDKSRDTGYRKGTRYLYDFYQAAAQAPYGKLKLGDVDISKWNPSCPFERPCFPQSAISSFIVEKELALAVVALIVACRLKW